MQRPKMNRPPGPSTSQVPRLKRTLVLHIGAHRTATTALQDYLYANFFKLQDEGFFYPYKIRRHRKLMTNILNGNRSPEGVATDISGRADKREQDIHTIILSDEDVSMRRDLSILAEFRAYFDVKVVYTLRRQDTWLESWFFQNIKWQWNKKLSHCTFDEFLGMREDFHWIHYGRYVSHLEELFGQENIILNVLEKDQMPQGPIVAFCDSIGEGGLTERAHRVDELRGNLDVRRTFGTPRVALTTDANFSNHDTLSLSRPAV